MNSPISIDFRSFVLSILPGGKFIGREYQVCNPRRADSSLGSFSINLDNQKWKDFAMSGVGGQGPISLYSYVLGISYREAAQVLSARRYSAVTYIGANSKPNAEELQKSETIQCSITKIWDETWQAHNTPVAVYLGNRGYNALIPASIRCHRRLLHVDGQIEPAANSYHPAMVAMVRKWPNTEVQAIHRTYLKHDGRGKADLNQNKKLLGNARGGAISLAPLNGFTLVLAEGIETALSVFLGWGLPTWSTISASFLPDVSLPPASQISHVIIAADHDDAGVAAAKRLRERLLYEGYNVEIRVPVREGEDFNDEWMRR